MTAGLSNDTATLGGAGALVVGPGSGPGYSYPHPHHTLGSSNDASSSVAHPATEQPPQPQSPPQVNPIQPPLVAYPHVTDRVGSAHWNAHPGSYGTALAR